jgi:hypothetical protein
MGLFESECRYCKSKEHASEDCPHGMFESKCRYCGSVNHASEDCPQGVFESKCRYCGSKDHAGENCPQGVFESKCRYCGSIEHASEDCPHGMFESKCRYCGSKNHASEDCPQGAFGKRKPTIKRNSNDDSSSADDDNSGAKIVGWLIGVGIVVMVVIWLAVNVVLPIALLNSALALTVLALVKKDRKSLFAVLALIGGSYMFFDIMKGWLSANFVNNVVKDKSWISAFVYINSAALGLSTWFLVSPLWEKAKLLATTEKQKRLKLMGISILLVIMASVSIPILYNTVQNPFSQNLMFANNNTSNSVSSQPERTNSNNAVANNNSSSSIRSTKYFNGNVGKLEATYSLNWYSDGRISGTYSYPARPNTTYSLQGRDLGNGSIELTEYTGSNISANCTLSLQGNCYVGQMNNTDGRHLKMTMCEGNSSSGSSKNDSEIAGDVNKFVGVWSNDDYPMVEIILENNNYRIRQCFGSDATDGTEFFGTNSNGKITAQGNAQDYYKFQLPTFEIFPNGKLHYDCGAGPYELNKSNKKMPNVNYSAPVNYD